MRATTFCTSITPSLSRSPYAAPFEYEFLYALLGDSGAYAYLEPWYGFSVSKDSDEAELAWRIVTPVVEGWAEGLVPLQEYPAGSEGPAGESPPPGPAR